MPFCFPTKIPYTNLVPAPKRDRFPFAQRNSLTRQRSHGWVLYRLDKRVGLPRTQPHRCIWSQFIIGAERQPAPVGLPMQNTQSLNPQHSADLKGRNIQVSLCLILQHDMNLHQVRNGSPYFADRHLKCSALRCSRRPSCGRRCHLNGDDRDLKDEPQLSCPETRSVRTDCRYLDLDCLPGHCLAVPRVARDKPLHFLEHPNL